MPTTRSRPSCSSSRGPMRRPSRFAVQAAVVDQLADQVTVRFVDTDDEAIDDTVEDRPVKEGVLLRLGPVPLKGDPVEVTADRYRTLTDQELLTLSVRSNGDGWSARVVAEAPLAPGGVGATPASRRPSRARSASTQGASDVGLRRRASLRDVEPDLGQLGRERVLPASVAGAGDADRLRRGEHGETGCSLRPRARGPGRRARRRDRRRPNRRAPAARSSGPVEPSGRPARRRRAPADDEEPHEPRRPGHHRADGPGHPGELEARLEPSERPALLGVGREALGRAVERLVRDRGRHTDDERDEDGARYDDPGARQGGRTRPVRRAKR